MASRVAVTTGAPASAAAFSPTLPTHQAGDRLHLYVLGKYDTASVPTINQSWVRLKSGTGGVGSTGNDVGPTFWAVYAKDALSSSETAPTVTPGGTAPNSWEWVCTSHRPGTGKVWRDVLTNVTDPTVQSASDTNTTTPLTGTCGAWTGVQPTAGDAIFGVGVIPTDLGTAMGATTITATGLSGGSKDTTSTNYVENSLGADTAAVWTGWTGFSGTASAGLALSFAVTGASNLSGSLVGVAIRETDAPAPVSRVLRARAFDGETDDIHTGLGALQGMTHGTFAFLTRRGQLVAWQTVMGLHNSGGTCQIQLGFSDTDTAFFFTPTGPTTSLGPAWANTVDWVLVVARKASGSVAPRFSLYNLTTGIWSHGAGDTAVPNWTAPGAGGTIRTSFGGAEWISGPLLYRAAWANELPWAADTAGDAAIEGAGLHWSLRAWYATRPHMLQRFDQLIAGLPVLDEIAGAHQTLINGAAAFAMGPRSLFDPSPPRELIRVPVLPGEPDPLLIEEQSGWSNGDSGSPGQGTASNITFTLGGGVQVGDLVLLVQADNFYELSNLLSPQGTAVTTWVEKTDNGLPVDGSTNDNHARVWVGTVTTAGGTVIARRTQNDDEGYAQIVVFRDAEFDTADGTETDTAGTSHAAPSLTPASGQTHDWLVCVWGTRNAPTNYTVPGRMTPYTEQDVFGINTYRAAVERLTTDSATGTRTATSSASTEWFAVSVLIKAAGGGTTVPISLAGSVTPAGALIRQPQPRRAGSSTAAGALLRQAQRPLAGSSTAAAVLTRQTQRTLAGSSTPSGALATVRTKLLSIAGQVASSGVLTRQTQRPLTASSAPVGTLTRQPQKRTLAGSSTAAGAVATVRTKLLSLAGSSTPAGALLRQPQRLLAGTATAAGTLTAALTRARTFTGSTTPAGTLVRRTSKPLAGTSTPAGAVATVRTKLLAAAGSLTSSGVLTRQTRRTLAATSTPTGALTRQTQKPPAGSVTASGALAVVKAFLRTFGGSVTAAGAATRQARRALGGTAAPAGALVRRTSRTLTGASTASGAVARTRVVPKALAGTVTAAGTVRRQLARSLGGIITPTGTALKLLSRLLGGTSTPSGTVAITGGGLGIPDEAPYHFTFRPHPRPSVHEATRPDLRESRQTPSMREGSP